MRKVHAEILSEIVQWSHAEVYISLTYIDLVNFINPLATISFKELALACLVIKISNNLKCFDIFKMQLKKRNGLFSRETFRLSELTVGKNLKTESFLLHVLIQY